MKRIKQQSNKLFIFLTLISLMLFSTVNAQWYRVDKHAKKGWKESRKWLNKAAKTGANLADLDQINALAEDGLSLAEDGIGGLEDFAEDLGDDVLSALEDLSEQLVEEIMDAAMGDMEPYIEKTGLFLSELYNTRPDLAENAVNALLDMAETGQTNDAYNAYLAIHEALPSFQALIDEVTSSGPFNTSVLFAASVGAGAIVGGEYTVGLAIEPGVAYINLAAFQSYGGTIGVEFPGAGGGLLLGFAVANPTKLAGPSLNGNMSVGIGVIDVGASVEISLPKIKGSFPDYDLDPPEFSSFTVDAGAGVGIPARGSITVGAGFTSILQGSQVYFDPDAPLPNRVFGTDGDDYLEGSGEKDFLYGLDGNDEIHGGNTSDVIEGGDGNDVMHGGGGHDHMYGDAGDDVFYSGDGKDVIRGGDGYDTVHFPGKKKNYIKNQHSDHWVIKKEDGSKKTKIYDCELAVFKNGKTKSLE